MDAQNALWSVIYSLEEWVFLCAPGSVEAGQPRPFLWDIKGDGSQGWYLLFTSSARLREFAAGQPGFSQEDGGVLFLSMHPLTLLEWLEKQPAEVSGVRFNQGETGFFAPLGNLRPIYDHLVNHGLLDTQ